MPRGGHKSGRSRLLPGAGAVVLGLITGCATTAPSLPVSNKNPIPAGLQPSTEPVKKNSNGSIRQVSAEAQSLQLPDLLALAVQGHPELATAAAKVEEARGQMIQAGLYPNPSVGYMGNQINDGPGTAGQQGGYFTQEIVTGKKLSVARRAGEQGLAAADWQAATKWYEIQQRVRSAYYEYQAAQAVLRESEQIVVQFEEGLRKADNLARAGTVLTFEVARFRIELTQARNRVGAAEQRLQTAERVLAVAVGLEQLPGPVVGETLPAAAPPYDFAAATASFEHTSYIREAVATVEQARTQVKTAQLQNVPNLMFMGAVMHDFTIDAPMGNAQAGVMVPLWNKNQGNILAAKAQVAQALANLARTKLQLRERLATAFQKYHNAQRQIRLYEEQILPDARTTLEQVEKLYDTRGERFFETLDARRVLAQSRIDYQQALGELWQAVAEIEAIVQPPHNCS